MKRNMVIILSNLAVLTVLGFYLPGLLRAADCPEPKLTCTLFDLKGNRTGYSVQIDPMPPGEWPQCESTGKCKWDYKLIGFGLYDKILQINTLAPDCCPQIEYSFGLTDTGGKIYPLGAGVPITFFGYGNFQDWAISLPLSSAPNFSFYSDQYVPSRKTSIQVNAWLKGHFLPEMFFCKEIAGPACPDPLTTIAASTSETIAMDNGITVCLAKHPNSKCPIVVDCNDAANGILTELRWRPIQEVLGAKGLTNYEPIYFGGVPGQDCPKIFLRTQATSGTSSWICTGSGRCYYQ